MKKTSRIPLLVAGVLLACGCSPTISFRADTTLAQDGSCIRKAIITGYPNSKIPNMRVKISDYLELPEAEQYETFVLTPARVMFGGKFEKTGDVPADFIKITPASDLLAHNELKVERVDLVLLEVMDFEERFVDIATRAEGEQALEEMLSILLETISGFTEFKFGDKYDLTELKLFLRETFPPFARRLYAYTWELRRARRAGTDANSERDEWKRVLQAELSKIGMTFPEQPSSSRMINDVLQQFAKEKLPQLVTPKQENVPPFSLDMLLGKSSRTEFLNDIRAFLDKQYGSMMAFMQKIDPPLTKVLGAFLLTEVSIVPTNPEFDFQMRLKMPGHIVQTNGLRDFDGRILWQFDGHEVALSGKNLWARSAIVNVQAAQALGLVNFPGQIKTIEMLFQLLHDRHNSPHDTEEVFSGLRESVKAGSFEPLAKLAHVKTEAGDSTPSGKTALKLVQLLERFRPSAQKQPEPELTDTEEGMIAPPQLENE